MHYALEDAFAKDYKARYEVMRLQTVLILNHFIPRSYRKVTDLYHFDWEEPEIIYVPTKEEWDALERKYRGV